MKYVSKMGEGGFRYLYDSGIVYEDAHHAHSNTDTKHFIFLLIYSVLYSKFLKRRIK
jgi:hypothetical protein